jgi:hypothetical protein
MITWLVKSRTVPYDSLSEQSNNTMLTGCMNRVRAFMYTHLCTCLPMHSLPHVLCRQQLVLGFVYCLQRDQRLLTASWMLIGGY